MRCAFVRYVWVVLQLLCAISIFCSAGCSQANSNVGEANNRDFEKGRVGELPEGWVGASAWIPSGGWNSELSARLSDERPHEGRGCLEIARLDSSRTGWASSGVQQTISAAFYRGQRVQLSGWMRFVPSNFDSSSSSARLWIRSDGRRWSFDDLGENPVRSGDWTFARVTCEVAADAGEIAYGASLFWHGKAYFDDLKLTVVGRNGTGNEPARRLSDRGTENLVAFARLLGYVRHFHPSDEAAGNDWSSFTIAAVEEVEGAKTAKDLIGRFQKLFRPIAPTLRLSTVRLAPVTIEALGGPETKSESITGWWYTGWPGPYPASYEAERTVAPVYAPGDSLLPIGSEVNSYVGGGVWCSVPLTLYRNSRGTIPRGAGTIANPRRSPGWVATGDDRATRIAAVILLWNVMQHFYPYFDVTGANWSDVLPIGLRAAAADPDGASFQATLQRMSASLGDGHVSVGSPYRSLYPSRWPVSWSFVEGRLVLVSADTTLSGEARIGDEVVALQGRPTSAWVTEASTRESGATHARVLVRVAGALRTAVGSDSLTLDLRSPAGKQKHVRLTQNPEAVLRPSRPAAIEEIRPGVMYIDLTRISAAQLDSNLPRIEHSRGVVFDMRGYPYGIQSEVLGHLTDSTLLSARWGRRITLRPDHQDTTFSWKRWTVEPKSPRIRAHAAFLIDANAISAAETMLGIVEHYHLADLVGEPTAGTNGNITLVLLPGRYTIPFTGMRVLKHDGSRHHGIGILPTVPVSPTIEGIAAGRDEQLERAIEVVSRPKDTE